MAWEKVCRSKVNGGAGLRNWKIMIESLRAKLTWSIYANPNQLWVKVMRGKYLDSMEDHIIFTIINLPKGFAIWNFIVSCRKVITNHLIWHIGNGRLVKFWDDSWVAYPAIKDTTDLSDIKTQLCRIWGDRVRDYMEVKYGAMGEEWIWKDLSVTGLTDAQQNLLKQILDQRKIFVMKE